MKTRMIVIAINLWFFCVFFGGVVNARVIFEDDFDSYMDSPENHGWGIGSNVAITETEGRNGSRGIMVTYNTSGTSPYWFGKNINAEQLGDIYVRFYFKAHDPEYAGTEDAYYGGCKFLKIFGSHDGEGYANTTWAINYNHPMIREVSYGDGSGLDNDCQCIIRFAGSHTDPEVVVHTTSTDYSLVDNQWHCFEAYFKYNTNGNSDGEYQVWIDGSTVVHATNVKNRNDLNAAYFNAVHFANYSHYNTHTWYLYYDDIVFADNYIGIVGDNDTTSPTRSNGQPTGTLSSGTNHISISLTTNEDATCKYSVTSGTVYGLMGNLLSTGGTTHSTTVSGLSDGNSYTYYVRCQDASKNTNTDDFEI
ncbi:MAG: hypothetical protein DRP78_01645, partial [Candidatus Omnitrophota bacterium]